MTKQRVNVIAAAGVALLMVGIAGYLARPVLTTGGLTGSGSGAAGSADPIRPEEITTLLPRDGILAVDNPSFVSARAASFVPADAQVIGVTLNGEAHAYPIPFLSEHEIVNDTVGGRDIAVTW